MPYVCQTDTLWMIRDEVVLLIEHSSGSTHGPVYPYSATDTHKMYLSNPSTMKPFLVVPI